MLFDMVQHCTIQIAIEHYMNMIRYKI